MFALESDARRRPVPGHHDGVVGKREKFRTHAVQNVGVRARVAERAADASCEERIAGKNRRAEQIRRRAVGVSGRVQHAHGHVVAERQFFAVFHEQGAGRERSDRVHVGAMHHDLRVGKRSRDVVRRVAVIGVFVGDEDVLQMVRAFAQHAQQISGHACGIDERGATASVEKEDVAVARMRILRMMAYVRAFDLRRTPRAGRTCGERTRIEREYPRDLARLRLVRRAMVLRPTLQRCVVDARGTRDQRRLGAGAAHRLAKDVSEFVLERQHLGPPCPFVPYLKPGPLTNGSKPKQPWNESSSSAPAPPD